MTAPSLGSPESDPSYGHVELDPFPTPAILGRAVKVEFSGAVETVSGHAFGGCVNAPLSTGDQGLGFVRRLRKQST